MKQKPVGSIPSRIAPGHRDRGQQPHKGVIFVESIPISTKRAFKAACAANSESMRDAFIRLMRHYVAVEGSLPDPTDD